MNISDIIDFLEDNGLCEAEEIKNDGDVSLIKFYYDFDNDEKSAAKSYANEESDFEAESDEWFAEYYSPYLNDIALDNVESILEELMDEFEIESKYKNLGMLNGANEYCEFIAAVCDLDCEIDLEETLNDYEV